MNFQKGKKNDDLEINFIPLIDVLLVIIIFLVVSTTFARFSQLKINLPIAEANVADNNPNYIGFVSNNNCNDKEILDCTSNL